MKSCPSCVAEVSGDMKFCWECGAQLTSSHSTISFDPDFEGGVEVGAAGLVELDQVEGAAGRRMHDMVGEKMVLGRSRKSDIVLDDVTVSREHSEILRGGEGFRIRDTGSLNGTYVNRVRVDSVDLRDGDEIQIGKYRFKFVQT